MKRLQYTKANNLSWLHDQLLAAIPALGPVLNARGELEAVMVVEGKGTDIWLTVPDAADEAAIADVVRVHDASAQRPLSATEKEKNKRIADAAAELTAEIDKAFLARSTAAVKVGLTDAEKTAITGREVNLIDKSQGR